jgi:hypothetical protein
MDENAPIRAEVSKHERGIRPSISQGERSFSYKNRVRLLV